MIIRNQTLGHRHRQERYAERLHKFLYLVVDLRILCTFSKDNSRTFGRRKQLQRAVHRFGRRYHGRSWIYGSFEPAHSLLAVHHCAEAWGGDIKIYAAGTSANGSTVGAYHSRRNIFRFIDAVCSLHQTLGHV